MSALTNIRRAAFSTSTNAHKISFKSFCQNCPLFYTQMDAIFCFGCPVVQQEQRKVEEKDNIIHREALTNWQKEKNRQKKFVK